MNKQRLSAILSIVLILILAIAIECLSRAARYFLDVKQHQSTYCRSDPIYHHSWTPSTRSAHRNRDIPFLLTMNQQGWVEEHEVEITKPRNTYRIFCLGDSNVTGVVDTKYKMVKIVERELNKKDAQLRFETINAGTSSYAILQYYLLAKNKLLQYSPDLVILNIDMTDASDDTLYRRLSVKDTKGEIIAISPGTKKYILTYKGYAEINPRFDPPLYLCERSAFFNLLHRAIIRYCIKNKSAAVMLSDGNWLAFEWSKEVTANVEESMSVLASTIEFLKSHGVKVALTGVPIYPQYTGDSSARPHYVLRQVAEKEHIPYLNSYEALKERITGTRVEQFYWATDPSHFNREGNRIWADAQLAFLKDPKNRLVPAD